MIAKLKNTLSNKPWIIIVVFYLSFVSCWITWLNIASEYAPETIEIKQTEGKAK